ncbi:MAG: flagellar hook-basal body complex protein FliE [Treponema sp.]|nr:flagellar hook-basal body complex protein FliE [Treponema sp.]
MKIAEFGTLQMVRTDAQHYGTGDVVSLTALSQEKDSTGLLHTTQKDGKLSFQDYLLQSMDSMNAQQNDVTKIQEQLITDPDSVDVHDVTIAMQKARMSLSLAQTVIDRLVNDWNEITTTR